MQFAPPPAAAPRAFFAACASGSETPSPASAPTCRKLRRLTRSQSRDRPVVKLSTATLLSRAKGGQSQAGARLSRSRGRGPIEHHGSYHNPPPPGKRLQGGL